MPCGYVSTPVVGALWRRLPMWCIFCVRLLRCPFYSEGHTRASVRGTGRQVWLSRFLFHTVDMLRYAPAVDAAIIKSTYTIKKLCEAGPQADITGMKSIGQLIKEELERQERPVSWFARKLYIDRSSVYRLFQKNSIDTALLRRICVVLNKDFFAILSEDYSDSDSQ